MLTVLIPYYNTRPEHFAEALYSILNQTYRNFSVIIIDDGSDVPLDISNIKSDIPIKLIRIENNQGTAAALNEGHKHVQTDFVAIMGSDDYSHPERFKIQMEYLANNPGVDVLGTNLFAYWNCDMWRKPIFTTDHKHIPIREDWPVNHGTVIYRNSAVMAVGGYNVTYKRGQDVELWKRMRANGSVFRNIEQVLYSYRRYK